MAGHSNAFLQLVDDARSRIEEIDASDMPAVLAANPDAALIDTREQNEFAAGHLKGAVWLGKGIIERDIEAHFPDHSQPLYLYCGGGFRSALAADNLKKMGYQRPISVDGGWRVLKDILPVE